MEKTIALKESKYINPSRGVKSFSKFSLLFFFTLYVLPQYFGLPLPFFDLSALRIMIITMLIFILGIKQKKNNFMELITKAPYSKVICPYLLITFYTAVYRFDFNAFFYPLIEFISFYILIYVIQYSFGLKKTLKYLIVFSYIITALGLVEYVIQRSPFSYLEMIKGLYTGQYIRSGHYRIMGPMNHSLTYGLMLITMVPIICYDLEKEEINLLKNKILFIMLAINIFLTGSRSTLGIFIFEVILLFLFSKSHNIKRYILFGSFFAMAIIFILIIFKNASFTNYILLQITSLIDELLGSTYSIRYGADQVGLTGSSNYREQLKYIFKVDWLNPLIGKGRNIGFSYEVNGTHIRSIDNFYISEFIRYAYPGMISYIVFLLYFLFNMLKTSIQNKSQFSKMLFTGSLCFCINILWLEAFPRYLYILFALYTVFQRTVLNQEDRLKKNFKT